MVQMSHILTAAEGELGAPMRHAHGRHQAYEELDGAEIHVTLDDRELWTKFQCLTNEMIVTKNGRYAKGAGKLTFETRDSMSIKPNRSQKYEIQI